MGSIKDRNGMQLTEAEDIKNRWQEYTKELYKKDLRDPDNQILGKIEGRRRRGQDGSMASPMPWT